MRDINQHIKKLLDEGIDKSSWFTFVDQLQAFKELGGQQEMVLKIVSVAQLTAQESENEKLSEFLIEVLELISGWCSPRQRIWENVIS
ncbi:MAG: hypothetical protein ACI9J3_003591 [Parvicellaceae bacterium]|jgi:hypothetical protein